MHLLHLDSSFQGDRSVSRRLSARAAERWRSVHPDGTVSYRDFHADPLPHYTLEDGPARSAALIDEIKRADTVLLGLPLYNFGAPSTVKAWVDHLILAGESFHAETREPFLTGKDFIVLASRGGGYAAGTPREGWDHAETWLPHGISLTGLEPRFITAELTLAPVTPAMAELVPLAEQSLAAAEAEIDALWTPIPVPA
ncbi:NAD(P)H-dependent oxidoreductase [Solirubrobacter phytolaccae]|uniref:FMN dependent NADH:quinone oxidoreductase n=1 Tax=Solirubrobacter phytolaccae TaxID=1404360 RepID=A0A9X3NBV2_9ACTN|nr:NAD(P)H-dependent oxidoreductase [Solirubrobacter phytolaccae]MDA0183805.1 NAD(P)H-dependent oxidoreductase [Solirubrobacter phytolaccae]